MDQIFELSAALREERRSQRRTQLRARCCTRVGRWRGANRGSAACTAGRGAPCRLHSATLSLCLQQRSEIHQLIHKKSLVRVHKTYE
jgi:hypothetical protein